jgi:hypothetical protein
MIVYTKTFDEYLKALRSIFECARQRKFTFNPKKCKFLWTEFNALGLTLTTEGVKMQEEKIKKVLDFPVPVQGKHLKSFLGLANYFRDFIPMYSDLVAPLNKLIKDYKATKHKRLEWTEELMNRYFEVQKAISNCQLLYFLDDVSPIYLVTDASNYGFGAYLCQIVEEKEHPIAFLSKSFIDAQTRWMTPGATPSITR